MTSSHTIKLDDADRAILRVLQEHGNYSIAEISKRVGLSHTPCWKRVKKLQEAGVITAQVALVNPELVGLKVTVFAFATLPRSDEETLQQFEAAVENIDQVVECYGIFGEKDFILKVVAESVESYERLLRKTLIHLPGVSSIDSTITLSCGKNTTRLPL